MDGTSMTIDYDSNPEAMRAVNDAIGAFFAKKIDDEMLALLMEQEPAAVIFLPYCP